METSRSYLREELDIQGTANLYPKKNGVRRTPLKCSKTRTAYLVLIICRLKLQEKRIKKLEDL